MDIIEIEDRFGESRAPWGLTKVFSLTAEHMPKK